MDTDRSTTGIGENRKDALPAHAIYRLGSPDMRHWAVGSLCFARESRQVVSAGCGGIRLFDVQSGALLLSKSVHGGAGCVDYCSCLDSIVYSSFGDWNLHVVRMGPGFHRDFLLRHSPGAIVKCIPGTSLAISTERNECHIRLWNLRSGTCLQTITGSDNAGGSLREAGHVTIGADGKTIAFVGDSFAIWSLTAEQRLQRQFRLENMSGRCVALCPSRLLAAVGKDDGTVAVIDLGKRAQIQRISAHANRVGAVAFSRDGAFLFTTGEDATLRAFDLNTLKEVSRFSCQGSIMWSLALSEDGTKVGCGTPDGRILILNVPFSYGRQEFPRDDNRVQYPCYSSDSRWIAAGGGPNGTVHVWDGRYGQLRFTLPEQRTNARCAFVGANQFLLIVDQRGFVSVLDTEDWARRQEYELASVDVTGLTVASDGEHVATMHADGSAMIWEWHSGRRIETLFARDSSGVSSIAFCPGESVVAYSTWGKVDFVDFARGIVCATINPRSHDDLIVTMSSRSQLALASRGVGNSLEIWNVRSIQKSSYVHGRRLRCEHSSYRELAFTPDGRFLAYAIGSASVGACVIHVCRAVDGIREMTLAGHGNWIDSLQFSCDGRRLLSGSFDGTGIVWDVSGLYS
ncbi:MAG: WD40 repeat domain-containing protein [Planctomycetes bacterium]|nr:WD40 repeat domain-containing protein [Planctomycetota bacterium]